MSDFDTALERLVSDPAFRDALAADPARALAGYHLEPDELDLLTAQIDTGTGGQRHVEERTSKASLFGLLSPMGGGGSGTVDALHGGSGSGTEGFGSPGGPASPAYVPADDGGLGGGPREGFGSAGQEGFGPASGGGAGTDGSLGSTFGGVVSGDAGVTPGRSPDYVPEGSQSQGTIYGSAAAGTSDQFSSTQPPADYHTRVDADGDGRWDRFTAIDRGDRGVDLVVDRDGDGRPEFIGHDYNRDGLIDAADTDDDHDGRLDSRWVDDNGDGWLDHRTALPADPPPATPAADLPPPDQAGRGFER